MALITNDIQARLAKLLSEEGLVRAEVISQSVENAKAANQSLIAYFLENKIVDNEILVHAISYVSGDNSRRDFNLHSNSLRSESNCAVI